MEQILNVNSIKIWTETFGDKNDNAVLLVAGAMAPAVFWPKSFCEALAALGYFVIRFDNRDIGYSTHFEPCRPESGTEMPYTIDDMAEDAAGVLNHFEIKKAIIAGHSLGCTITQFFAVKYPARVERLFLISSPIIAMGSNVYIETEERITQQMLSVLMSNKMYQDYARGKDEFFRAWKYLNGKWELDESMAAEYTERLYETEHIEPAWNHTKVQENIRDIFIDINELPVIKHFIYGEIDYLPANPKNIETLVNSLDNADLEILPGAGHMFFHKTLWDNILHIFTRKMSASPKER